MAKKKIDEVFGIGVGINTPAYVDRGALDQAFKDGLAASRHVSVHGGSKQGKTWLRKRGLAKSESIVVQCTTTSSALSVIEEALDAIGVTASLSQTSTGRLAGELNVSAAAHAKLKLPLVGSGGIDASGGARGSVEKEIQTEEGFFAQTAANLRWVSEAIIRSGKRFVIEDFHYLSEPEQRIFAYWMKALGEYGCHVVTIGVWAQSHLLSYFNGDLEGRVDDIHLSWGDDDLRVVLDRGSVALDVRLDPALVDSMVRDAYGNVGLVHRLAQRICHIEEVDSLPSGASIGIGHSLTLARTEVAAQMSGRFETFASNFVRGMRRMPKGLVVYLHLLRAFTSAEDAVLLGDGVDSKDLLDAIKHDLGNSTRGEDKVIRGSDLTQALERIDILQAKIQVSPPVLAYHRAGKKVQLVDRSFLFFRKYGAHTWPWEEDEDEIENDLAGANPLDLEGL